MDHAHGQIVATNDLSVRESEELAVQPLQDPIHRFDSIWEDGDNSLVHVFGQYLTEEELKSQLVVKTIKLHSYYTPSDPLGET